MQRILCYDIPNVYEKSNYIQHKMKEEIDYSSKR